MATSLIDLPLELQLMIFDELEDLDYCDYSNGLVPLSSTCKMLRELLASRIFFILEFTNQPESADAALMVANVYGRHFRRLSFRGVGKSAKYGPRGKGWNRKSSLRATRQTWAFRQDELLCPAARELLQGKHTPNARHVSIMWTFDFNDRNSELQMDSDVEDEINYDYADGRYEECSATVTYWFEEQEQLGNTRIAELNYAWRALMKLVWEALAENEAIRDLEIERVVARPSTVFVTPAWKAFLGRLTSLYLRFPKETDPLHCACLLPGFRQFTLSMDDLLLAPAQNLTDLTLCGSEYATMGCNSEIGFQNLHFPKLRILQVWDIGISQIFIEFLHLHSETVALLMLKDCWVYSTGPDEEPVKWASLFRALNHPKSAIRFFVYSPDDKDCYTDWDHVFDHRAEWKQCMDFLKKSGTRAFPYADASDEGHSRAVNYRLSVESLTDGADLREYDALMEKISTLSLPRASLTSAPDGTDEPTDRL